MSRSYNEVVMTVVSDMLSAIQMKTFDESIQNLKVAKGTQKTKKIIFS